MNEDRLIAAFGRLDRALNRVEQAAAAIPAVRDDTTLSGRHERLREATRAALADLDRLIGGTR